MKYNISLSEVTNNSNNSQIKRRTATIDSCRFDLKSDLPKIFDCFNKAVKIYNDEYAKLSKFADANYEAVNIKSLFMYQATLAFGHKAKNAKYRRFILTLKNHIIMFKKLDKKGRPMNIKTKNVTDIYKQSLKDLFGDTETYDPILFFGYQKGIFGEFINPQLIYIDDNQIKFNIKESDLQTELVFENTEHSEEVITPKIKNLTQNKKVG